MLWLATSWLQKGTNFKIHCLSGSNYEYLKMMVVLTMMAERIIIWTQQEPISMHMKKKVTMRTMTCKMKKKITNKRKRFTERDCQPHTRQATTLDKWNMGSQVDNKPRK